MTDALDLTWLHDLKSAADALADAEAAAQRDVDRHADKIRFHERRVADAQSIVDNFAAALNAAKKKNDAATVALSEAASKRTAAADKYAKAKAGVRAIFADVDVSTTDG